MKLAALTISLFIILQADCRRFELCTAQTAGKCGGDKGGSSSSPSSTSTTDSFSSGKGGGGILELIIVGAFFELTIHAILKLIFWILANTIGRLMVFLWRCFCEVFPGSCFIMEQVVEWIAWSIGMVVVILVLAFIIWMICLVVFEFFKALGTSIHGNLKKRILDMKLTSVRNKGASCAADPPSGKWAGCYREFDVEFDTWNVTLNFSKGKMSGSGRDGLSDFKIQGRYSLATLECVFKKQYCGKYNHVIRCDGKISEGRGDGIRGTWYNDGDKGQFGYWPIMANWGNSSDGNASAKTSSDVYKATDQFECIICFDNIIDCVLRPCGHVAVCSHCVTKLASKKCPVCRATLVKLKHIERGELLQL